MCGFPASECQLTVADSVEELSNGDAAFGPMPPGARFAQFAYSVVAPCRGVSVQASDRIWMNLPPARAYVYCKA